MSDDDPILRVIAGEAAGAGAEPGGRPGPDATSDDTTISDPARALRLATTVRGVLDELRGTEPGDPVRERLAALHDRTVEQLGLLVSADLRSELSELALDDAGSVSAAELRVVLAELVGWMEGVFHGLSAALVETDDGATEPPSRSGHYL